MKKTFQAETVEWIPAEDTIEDTFLNAEIDRLKDPQVVLDTVSPVGVGFETKNDALNCGNTGEVRQIHAKITVTVEIDDIPNGR